MDEEAGRTFDMSATVPKPCLNAVPAAEDVLHAQILECLCSTESEVRAKLEQWVQCDLIHSVQDRTESREQDAWEPAPQVYSGPIVDVHTLPLLSAGEGGSTPDSPMLQVSPNDYQALSSSSNAFRWSY